jgi:hypothetical protein
MPKIGDGGPLMTDDLDAVHGGEHRSHVALHLQALHAPVIHVRRYTTNHDAALQAVTRVRERARHEALEIVDCRDAEQVDLLLADERHRARSLEQRLREAE